MCKNGLQNTTSAYEKFKFVNIFYSKFSLWFCGAWYTAVDFKVVQKEVSDLLIGRILVGHAVQHDLKVGILCVF